MEAEEKTTSISLTIPSLQENIRIVESFIDNAKTKYEINDDIYGNILVSITEGLNNAIIHGNKLDKSKNVTIVLEFLEGQIKFSISDEGKGFDYLNLPDPTAPENIEKLGGRGLYLMKHLCDEIHFYNNGSSIELIFYID